MKFEYGIIGVIGVLVFLILGLVFDEPTEIPKLRTQDVVNVDILPGSATATQEENISPKVINVVIGVNNTVRWNNLDDVAHTLTPDHQYDEFSDIVGMLRPGESEEKTFEKPGVFSYHGVPGPWITGTIIVSEPSLSEDRKSLEEVVFQRTAQPESYQKCATFFDDIIEFQKDALVQCELDGNICELRPLEDVLAEAPISQEFRDNNCSLSVEGWAHLSENEDLIWSSKINWEKTIRLSNIFLMKPDSSEFFYYPNPDDTENRDAYQTFMLIRLPEWLGGNVDDLTAFRVYSALSVDDHCLIKYFPGERRQQIMNPCSGVIYRAIDGTMIMPFARVPGGQPIALPHLELSTDENGFLYIEPPVWSKTKNGVIGYGREITNSEIEQGSMFLINSFAKAHPDYPGVPPEFAGMTLANIVQEEDERFKILFSEFTPLAQNIEIFITKCDCEEFRGLHTYGERETIGNTTLSIHAIKSGGDDIPESINEYHIWFVKGGFEYEVVGKNLDFIKNSIAIKLLK